MAMNVTPFKSTDEFTMAGFNGKLSDINSGVNDEVDSILSEITHVKFGSYIGTGRYGASNPNSIIFDFVPKLVWIICYAGVVGTTGHRAVYSLLENSGYVSMVPMEELTTEYKQYFPPFQSSSTSSQTSYSKKSVDGKTLTWYNTAGYAGAQYNEENYTYYYIAIG